MAEPELPYGRHVIDEDDIGAVATVLRGDWLTSGPARGQFEAALAAATGAKHAVACANGTAALHLALMALGIGPGDAVVVPAVTFVASANAVRLVGAEVVFCDVDADSGLMTAELLTQALSRMPDRLRPRAVMPVHLRGLPCNMLAIAEVASRRDLAVVEDAAHALGASHKDDNGYVPVGGFARSRITCFSFHPVKTIAMGEGGAITTGDGDLAARLVALRNHDIRRDPPQWLNRDLGFGPDGTNPWYYEIQQPGLNYRISDIHCALGASQLRKLADFVGRRATRAALYDRGLATLAPLVRPHVCPPDARPAWHLYSALIDFATAGVSRSAVMAKLRDAGIGTQVHFIPVHLQPYYRGRYGDIELPGSRAYYERTLSLPLYPTLRDQDVERVLAELAKAVGCR